MAELLEMIESIRAEEASVQRLFGKDGEGMRRHGRKSQKYLSRLAEATTLIANVKKGSMPAYYLREAMSTSDFPYLFGDILDRQLLAAYQEAPATYRNYIRMNTVADFRTVKRYGVYGADQVLSSVGQQQQYPVDKINEDTPYSYSVSKFGRIIPFDWETLINDDLGAFNDVPTRLGRAARRSESKFGVQLFVDASGPHASMYTAGNKNKVTSNPALSITALQTAMQVLSAQVDQNGEPIYIDVVELVVPPALEVTARNILNATQLWMNTNASAGTPEQNLVTENWMKNRVRLNVEPYIPIVASTANGATSWFLFGNPDAGRCALEMGFLRGHEQPEIFMKSPDAMRVGGGEDALNGDFETDSIQYKVRHVFGGSRMDPKLTVASNGSGL
jgi:hypothetical protein